MSKLHQSSVQSSSWQMLDRHPRQLHLAGALRLQAHRAGWLTVQRGQVWLTRDGGGDDHVLARGEQFWLQPGDSVVIEPWRVDGTAQMGWLLGSEAMVQVPALRRGRRAATTGLAEGVAGAGLRGLAAVLRAAAGRLLAAARSAEAMASRAQGSIRAGDSMASCGAVQ